VPAWVADGDEAHARLDQPAGQQAALPEARAAVAVAQPRVFAADLEGPARFWGGDQVQGRLVVLIERSEGRRLDGRRRLLSPNVCGGERNVRGGESAPTSLIRFPLQGIDHAEHAP